MLPSLHVLIHSVSELTPNIGSPRTPGPLLAAEDVRLRAMFNERMEELVSSQLFFLPFLAPSLPFSAFLVHT